VGPFFCFFCELESLSRDLLEHDSITACVDQKCQKRPTIGQKRPTIEAKETYYSEHDSITGALRRPKVSKETYYRAKETYYVQLAFIGPGKLLSRNGSR
jgi:hypothetical protein